MDLQKTKVSIRREGLVIITGDYLLAEILNQFLYWTERVKDVDEYLKEEAARWQSDELDKHLLKGWVYKSAKDLVDELMLVEYKINRTTGARESKPISEITIRRRLKILEDDLNYLDVRKNPTRATDQTLQYRVALERVASDLIAAGYWLEGFKLPNISKFIISILQNEGPRLQIEGSKNLQTEATHLQTEGSTLQRLSETTSEIEISLKKMWEEHLAKKNNPTIQLP